MKKILLTSAGLTENLFEFLLKKVGKEIHEIKILYVPTAAMYHDGGREGLALSNFHLLRIGVLPKNIFNYHLGYLLSEGYERTYSASITEIPPQLRLLTVDEMKEFDGLLVDGGDGLPLITEMNRTGFSEIVKQAIETGLFYLGISAGSMVMTGSFSEGLNYLKNPILVHSENGTPCGKVPEEGLIELTDEQAIWIDDDGAQIIK